MTDPNFMDYSADVLQDLKRLRDLDKLAYSGKGITLDQSIERKDLQIKFKDRDVLDDLILIAERALGVS